MSDETPGSGRHARAGGEPEPTVDASSATSGSTSDAPTTRVPGEPTDPPTVDHDTPSGSPHATPTVETTPADDTVDTDDTDDTDEAGSPRGRVRYQDPESTKPREPTVAELRARREAEKRRQAQDAASAAAEERRRKNRKRLLVGGGVAVGLVAVVAIAYAASSDDDSDAVNAQCTDRNTGAVVPDENCGVQQGGYTDTSGHFVPLFIPFGGFGGGQYRYNYGTNAPIGTVPRGGTTTPPANGTTLRSGTSGGTLGNAGGNGSVSRGGLGVGGSSGSSSGS